MGYDYCTVYSDTSRTIGKSPLTRADDDDEKNQIVTIKKKEVFFQEGFSVVVGNKELTV